MSNIHVAIDNINGRSSDSSLLSSFCEKVKAAGHEVTNCGVGPSNIQNHCKRTSCDIMVQIAGGMCVGTFGDFVNGIKRGYYHAKKFCIPMYTGHWSNYAKYDPKKYALRRAWDDNFSGGLDLSPYLGKSWQQACITAKEQCTGFAEGKTVDELANNFLKTIGGGSSDGTSMEVGGGSSVLDLIKQVCSDWDPYGIELGLNGDKVTVKRTNPSTATNLAENKIQLNTISYVDYDHNTPNTFGDVKDQFLIKRFGEIPLDLEIEDTKKEDILRVAQRGHGHSIDLKCISNPAYVAGKWVNLTISELGIIKRPYFITKSSHQEERLTQLTLESAPPSIYVDVPEPTAEESTDEETSEEDL